MVTTLALPKKVENFTGPEKASCVLKFEETQSIMVLYDMVNQF
jgi:hypothetical protein